jgi:hypothetical protein
MQFLIERGGAADGKTGLDRHRSQLEGDLAGDSRTGGNGGVALGIIHVACRVGDAAQLCCHRVCAV